MEINKNLNVISELNKSLFSAKKIEIPSNLAEKHPHIVNKMATLWGTYRFNDYIDTLVIATPTPERLKRKGFSFEILMQISELSNIHNINYPQYIKKVSDKSFIF